MNAHSKFDKISNVNMTSKGQVLIPKSIREQLGLRPGHPVAIGINDRGEAVVMSERAAQRLTETREDRVARIRAAIESVRGTIDIGFATTDEYMDFIRPHRLDPL